MRFEVRGLMVENLGQREGQEGICGCEMGSAEHALLGTRPRLSLSHTRFSRIPCTYQTGENAHKYLTWSSRLTHAYACGYPDMTSGPPVQEQFFRPLNPHSVFSPLPGSGIIHGHTLPDLSFVVPCQVRSQHCFFTTPSTSPVDSHPGE